MTHRNILFFSTHITILLSLGGCSGDAPHGAPDKKEAAIAIVTARPSQGNSDGVTSSGQVEAVNTASISTRLMGTITRIYAKVGDKVRKGQLLAAISSEEIVARTAQADAQIAGAQAELENAQKDFDRYHTLFSKQSATASELDNATLRLSAARSRLESARQMRKEIDASAIYAHLTAPFAGIVTQKLLDEGSLATPGTPIMILEQNNLLRVNTTIAESDISRIKAGDKAALEIKSTGLKVVGSVAQISVSSIATGGQYQVKIDIPKNVLDSLYAGMYVNVFIPVKTSPGRETPAYSVNQTVLVPASALVEKDQLTGIYTVSNTHTALLRWVRTGKKVGDKMEILSGLNADEPFIASSSGKLYNGVSVIEK